MNFTPEHDRSRPGPRSPVAVDFQPVLRSPAPHQDGELADLIERDGRERLDRGLPCPLDRYYGAVPDLLTKPIALDAAIEVSLRSIALADGCSAPQEKHAECLLRSYPHLSGPIRFAAMFGNPMIASTVGGVARSRRLIHLPHRIGVNLDGGLPRYELLRPLGRGSSGTVFEAVDHLLSDAGHAARVAVKVIPVDPAGAHRQTAEATKARRIEHPGVVRVLDRGLTDHDELFLVYELVAGGDLQAWFDDRARRIEPRRAAEIVAEVAAGVQAAHSAGLVHCDLKPSNVLMDSGGHARVSDFGVSAMTEPFPGMRDGHGGAVPVGNLAFAAPEQVRRASAFVSPLVDVYALGGILFTLLTGMLPNGTTPEEVARTHDPAGGRRVAPLARSFNAAVDERISRICARAMHPRPEQRYATAGEIAADLRSWLALRPIAWLEESIAVRTRLAVRRSPITATLGATCLAAVLLGAFVSGYFARESWTLNRTHRKLVEKDNQLYQNIFEDPSGRELSNDEIMKRLLDSQRSAPAYPPVVPRPDGPLPPTLKPVSTSPRPLN